MSQMVRDICASLRNEPERWRLAPCVIARDDGVEVWRANLPLLDMGLWRPFEVRFTLAGKFHVYRAYRHWLKRMPLLGYGRAT